MKVLRSDMIVFFDVDDTLIGWGKPEPGPAEHWVQVQVPHWRGQTANHWIIKENVEAIKLHKSRGHIVVVWSAGGYEWAEAVVKALKMENYVDLVCSKPEWIYDDLEASVWMPKAKHLARKQEDPEDNGASENP